MCSLNETHLNEATYLLWMQTKIQINLKLSEPRRAHSWWIKVKQSLEA